MAILVGNTITNNFDRFTGEPFNATIVDEWWDGTPMSDSKVDNAIYFKNSNSVGGYSRRDFNGVIDGRWFGLSSISNSVSILTKIFAQKAYLNLLITTPDVLISSNIEFPEGFNIIFRNGGSFNVSSGVTVTFKSKIDSSLKDHIFKGSGTVNLYETSCEKASVCWFGAKGSSDLSFDSAAAVQKCVNASQRINKIFYPSFGNVSPYVQSQTIQVFSSDFSFSGFEIFGEGFQENTGSVGSFQKSSRIVYTGTSLSCFNLRGSRFSSIHDLRIDGQCPELIAANEADPDSRREVYWIGTTYNSTAKNHHCAISIDGISSSTLLSQNSRVYNCRIAFFVVGVSISANGNQQGDTIYVNNSVFRNCGYAISLGNAQNRSCSFDFNLYSRCYTVFTNRRFGNLDGSRFNTNGGQITNCYRMFDLDGAVGGNSHISGLYAEACGVIGRFGRPAATDIASYTLSGCNFKLEDDGFENNLPNHIKAGFYSIEVGGAMVVFNGGSIQSLRKVYAIACNQPTSGGVSFTGVFFTGAIEEVLGNQESALFFNNCQWKNLKINQNQNIRLDYTASALNRTRIGNASQFVISATLVESAGIPKSGFIHRVINNKRNLTVSAISIDSDDGRDISITWPNTSQYNERFGQSMVGDYFYTPVNGDPYATEFYNSNTAPSCIVKSINYTTRNIVLTRLAFEAVLGSTIYWSWRPTLYSAKITCSVTLNSATVTDVTNITLLAIGDCVVFANDEFFPYRIASIDSGTSTITLTQNYRGATNSSAVLTSARLILMGRDITLN